MKEERIILPSLPINLQNPIEVPILLSNIGSNNVKYKIDKNKFYHSNNISSKENIISFKNEDSNLQQNDKKYLIVLFKPNTIRKYTF